MTPSASPGGEGPTQAPPHLPPGWIAQWDANSKKYYYVQLSTGVSQWDIPTEAAPVGGTPAPAVEHPYGAPGGGQPELITHPDGSQTVKHPDGRMEPVMPDENGNARGMGDGQTGDRGLGSMAMNALLGGNKQGGKGGSANNLGGLASQVFSGLTSSGAGNHGTSGSHGSSGGSGLGGKLVGQLAQNLFSSGSKPAGQPSNYHNGQHAATQNSGGLAGSMMGGVAHMFGGQSHSSNQNYGYSNAGQAGGYNGSAPPANYQPPGVSQHQPASQHSPQGSQPSSSYHTPALTAQPHATPSYQTPPQQPPNQYSHAPQQHGTPSFPPPPANPYEGAHQGYPGSAQHMQYSQHGQIPGPPAGQPPAHQYGHPQGSASQYGQSQHGQSQHSGGGYGQPQPPAYGGQQGGYPHHQPPSQGQYPSQPSYGQGPPVQHGSHSGYGSNSHY